MCSPWVPMIGMCRCDRPVATFNAILNICCGVTELRLRKSYKEPLWHRSVTSQSWVQVPLSATRTSDLHNGPQMFSIRLTGRDSPRLSAAMNPKMLSCLSITVWYISDSLNHDSSSLVENILTATFSSLHCPSHTSPNLRINYGDSVGNAEKTEVASVLDFFFTNLPLPISISSQIC